jgi:putative ABC transport system substrate-binding protein
MKHRSFRLALAITAAAALSLTSCSSQPNNADQSSKSDASSSAVADSTPDAVAPAGGEAKTAFKVGITTIVQHPSLDLIAKGFKDVLSEQGLEITYDEQNAQGEASNAATIAGGFAEDKSIDMVLAIATPTAQAAVQAISDRPILFAGVTDPIAAGLVPGEGASGTNVTGTSDLNPNAKPVELIQEIVPGVKTIGTLYSSAETNSEIQVETYRQAAEALGISLEAQAIANSSEVATGAQALAGVDAILIPTDNTVVGALDAVIEFANQNKIPLFTADAESVEKGSIAARGISYYELGRRTGEMAVRILTGGEDPGQIPFLVVQETELKYNSQAAKAQGAELPEEILANGIDVAKQ